MTRAAGASLAAAGTLAASRTAQTGRAAMVVGRFAATLAAHDLTAVMALFADDYVNHQASVAAPPAPGESAPGEFQTKQVQTRQVQTRQVQTRQVHASEERRGSAKRPPRTH